MRLVTDWKQALRWHSVRISLFGCLGSAIGSALAATGAVVPWFAVLKAWEVFAMASVVFLGVLIGRIIRQEVKPNENA